MPCTHNTAQRLGIVLPVPSLPRVSRNLFLWESQKDLCPLRLNLGEKVVVSNKYCRTCCEAEFIQNPLFGDFGVVCKLNRGYDC